MEPLSPVQGPRNHSDGDNRDNNGGNSHNKKHIQNSKSTNDSRPSFEALWSEPHEDSNHHLCHPPKPVTLDSRARWYEPRRHEDQSYNQDRDFREDHREDHRKDQDQSDENYREDDYVYDYDHDGEYYRDAKRSPSIAVDESGLGNSASGSANAVRMLGTHRLEI